MTDPTSPDRYERILHAVGSVFDSLDAWPDHPRALEHVADAVEKLIDTELEASQRQAIRIQILLDERRDRARKDAAASRESERILQQQIDAQANEIDRLRDEVRGWRQGHETAEAQLVYERRRIAELTQLQQPTA